MSMEAKIRSFDDDYGPLFNTFRPTPSGDAFIESNVRRRPNPSRQKNQFDTV
jgi:hypothetical protein